MLEGMMIYFSRVFDFAHAFQLVLISLAAVWVLSPLRKDWRSALLGLVRTVGFFGCCMLCELLLFGLSNNVRALAGVCFPLAYMLTVSLYSVFFCPYVRKVKTIMAGVLFSTAVMVDLIKLGAFLLPVKDDVIVGLFVILLNLLNLLPAFVLWRFSIVRFDNVPTSATLLIMTSNSAIAIATFVYEILMINVFSGQVRASQTYVCISAVFLYVVDIIAYLMMYFICKSNREKLELQTESKMTEADAEMMRLTAKNLADIRQICHDTKNQYAYINMLAENGQYDDLKNYVTSMSEEILRPLAFVDSGNKVINNILNMEKAKAESLGFVFVSDLNVPPVLPFKDTSLCSVIANLIDNAIEACERYGLSDAEIHVTVSLRQEYLYIGVANPLPGDADAQVLLSLNTAKKNAYEHGFGTKIIQRIAEEYNGYVTYAVENGVFIAEVMLDLMKGAK